VTDDLVKRPDDEQDDLTLVYMWAYKMAEKKYKSRIEELEAALRPLAEKYLWPDDTGIADVLRSDEDWDEQKNNQTAEDMWIERGWIRAARAALGEKKDG
jgi:hypothetical protein